MTARGNPSGHLCLPQPDHLPGGDGPHRLLRRTRPHARVRGAGTGRCTATGPERHPDALSPRAIEYFDAHALDLVRARVPDIPQTACHALFVEVVHDGEPPLETWWDALEEHDALVDHTIVTEDDAGRARLHAVRHAVPAGVNEQVVANGMPGGDGLRRSRRCPRRDDGCLRRSPAPSHLFRPYRRQPPASQPAAPDHRGTGRGTFPVPDPRPPGRRSGRHRLGRTRHRADQARTARRHGGSRCPRWIPRIADRGRPGWRPRSGHPSERARFPADGDACFPRDKQREQRHREGLRPATTEN